MQEDRPVSKPDRPTLASILSGRTFATDREVVLAVKAAVVEAAAAGTIIEDATLFVVDLAESRSNGEDHDDDEDDSCDDRRPGLPDVAEHEYVVFAMPSFDRRLRLYVSTGLHSVVEMVVTCQTTGSGAPNANIIIYRLAERFVIDGRFETESDGRHRLEGFAMPARRERLGVDYL